MGGCSMIDGITIRTSITNREEWSNLTGIDLSAPTYISSGEMKVRISENCTVTKYYGKWEGFFIDLREVKRGVSIKYYLNIRGSFHKNHFNGKNYQPFNYSDLQYQIRHICKSLFIEPENARISVLEFGVNIITPFNVKAFLDNNVIDFKGKRFDKYLPDKRGLELGLFCRLNQYQIKLYDKGKQNNLDFNLMRFEKKYKKMQVLKKMGIIHLSDLLDRAKVYSLKSLLLKAWNDVLIYDIEDTELLFYKISEEDIRFLSDGRNYKYWEIIKKANRNKHNYKRKKYKELVKRFGLNYHSLIYKNLGETWDRLFDNSTNLPVVISTQLNNLTIKIKGKYNESISKYCNPCIWNGPTIVKYN
jgi:hypothetical protein